jgi:TM2 domain-containing membrane protein YozV
LGVFGAHRFYAGKTATGVLQLVTLGGFGIWTLVDFIRITIGSFKDGDGNRITEWV